MDVTMIGLQNAGKTSLLRVLAVSQYERLLMILLTQIEGRRVHSGVSIMRVDGVPLRR